MIILALAQLLCIGGITLYEYRKKAPVVFCWATLLLMFGIMHVISVFIDDNSYSEGVLNKASIFVIAFCTLYMIARIFSRIVFKNQLKDKEILNSKNNEKLLLAIDAVLICSVLLSAFWIIRVSGSIMSVRKESDYLAMIQGGKWYLLSSYLYYSTAPIILYYIKKKKMNKVVFIGILIIIKTYLSQARMDLVILFVGIIGIIILNQKKLDIRNIVLLGLMAVFVIYAIYALRTFRYYNYNLSTFSFSDLSEFNEHLVEFIKTDEGELGYRQVFYYFIKNNNEFAGFGNGAGYKRVLMLPFPSRITFGAKPEDMCITMGRVWKPSLNGIINYTITPTLFGDCYANLGFLGVILGAFWGVIATITDVICNRKNEILRALLFCMVATQFIIIGRGSIYNPLCCIYYGCILIAGYVLLSRVRIRS